jgi:hypothetical protein
MTNKITPITHERIEEISAMLRDGEASDEAEREIWKAAQMVPELVDMLRAYIDQFDDDYGDDADELRRNARFLIGE